MISVPFAYYVYTHEDPWFGLWVYAIPTFLGSYYLGPTFSLAQSLVGLRVRALAASILLFILNLIGLGLETASSSWASWATFCGRAMGEDRCRWPW